MTDNAMDDNDKGCMVLIAIILAALLMTGAFMYFAGRDAGISATKLEACANDAAHYTVGEAGKPVFTWGPKK